MYMPVCVCVCARACWSGCVKTCGVHVFGFVLFFCACAGFWNSQNELALEGPLEMAMMVSLAGIIVLECDLLIYYINVLRCLKNWNALMRFSEFHKNYHEKLLLQERDLKKACIWHVHEKVTYSFSIYYTTRAVFYASYKWDLISSNDLQWSIFYGN